MTFASLANPAIGLSVAAAITSMMSRPDSLDRAGDNWLNIRDGINDVGTQLKALVDSVPAEKWTAADREAFDGAVRTFQQTLNEGVGTHDDAAKIMHGVAKVSYQAAVVSAIAGGLLGALALTRFIPGVNLVTAPASQAIAIPVQRTVLGLAKKYGMAAAAAGTVLMMAMGVIQSKQAELDANVQAMKAQGPALKNVGLTLTNTQPAIPQGQTGIPQGQTGIPQGQTGIPQGYQPGVPQAYNQPV
ncbi:hypothetical protein [Sphaerisporangium flaviroseum]|uniref:hypothetical protein n=1 Tax=Sphaerisporangium flaviroseum TaxID=509199 RepID=UPI0031ECB2CF